MGLYFYFEKSGSPFGEPLFFIHEKQVLGFLYAKSFFS